MTPVDWPAAVAAVRSGVVFVALVVLILHWTCHQPPEPPPPTPGQSEAVALAQRNAVLEAQVAATVARVQRDSLRLDSLARVAQLGRAAVARYATRADSAVARARADSATHEERVAAYEDALTLKDSALAAAETTIVAQGSAIFLARADLVLLGRDLDSLRVQNAALVSSTKRLSGEVDTWRRRASRRWYPCGGGGAVAGIDQSGAHAGPGIFVGVCRVVRWP